MNAPNLEGPSIASAPREVPFATRVALRLLSPGFQLACVLIAVAFATRPILVDSEAVGAWAFHGDLGHASGVVTSVEPSGVTERRGATRRSGRRDILRVGYEFEHAGATLSGASFTPSTTLAVGAPCAIEFVSADPQCSRIAGLRSRPRGRDAYILLVFPLGALVALAAAELGARRTLRLLEHGRAATGQVVAIEPGSRRKRKRRSHATATVLFEVEGGAKRTLELTARSEDLPRLESGVPVLFDPRRSSLARAFEDLPTFARFDPRGRVQSTSAGMLSFSLVLPTLAALALTALELWRALR